MCQVVIVYCRTGNGNMNWHFFKSKKTQKNIILFFYWFKHYSLFHYISIGITYLQVFNNNVNYSNVHTQLFIRQILKSSMVLFLKTVCWRRTSTVSWELLIFCCSCCLVILIILCKEFLIEIAVSIFGSSAMSSSLLSCVFASNLFRYWYSVSSSCRFRFTACPVGCCDGTWTALLLS